MFFKKKPKTSSPTLKARVEEFWKWYSANAERFHATIQAKRCSDLTQETSEAVDKHLPGMAWVYGPGEHEGQESFTLSGEAILPKQFVAEYWLSKAPKLKDWIFYSSRQPSKERSKFSIKLEGDHMFKTEEFWLAPYVDTDAENIDVKVWHPSLHRLDHETRMTALFLILDELLGEHGTENWIGDIDFSEEHLKTSIPIAELPELIHATQKEHDWKKYPAPETYSSYQLKPQDQPSSRSDTVAGTTRYFSLLRGFFDAKGPVIIRFHNWESITSLSPSRHLTFPRERRSMDALKLKTPSSKPSKQKARAFRSAEPRALSTATWTSPSTTATAAWRW